MRRRKPVIENIDIIVPGFIFFIMFALPLIFARENGEITWNSVLKVWQDKILLIPLFAINHWLLVPGLALRKKYGLYVFFVIIMLSVVTTGYYLYDKPGARLVRNDREMRSDNRMPPRGDEINEGNPGSMQIPRDKQDRRLNPPGALQDSPGPGQEKPQPVPPYADLLLFSLLIVAVDTGLSFTKSWHSSEEEMVRLEKENIAAQLGILRNQVSPHFFMNTLNNIYSLIDGDRERSKNAVMKLSKLMRYLLYENKDGKVLLSREFDFIKSYIDLIKLRYVDDIEITLSLPGDFGDTEIPGLLFISYIENAFKFGASYEKKSDIFISFSIRDQELFFICNNSKNVFMQSNENTGIGLKNSRERLDLLYGSNYTLDIKETDERYSVEIKIPLA